MTVPPIQETRLDGVIAEFAFGVLARKEEDCYPGGTAVIMTHISMEKRRQGTADTQRTRRQRIERGVNLRWAEFGIGD